MIYGDREYYLVAECAVCLIYWHVIVLGVTNVLSYNVNNIGLSFAHCIKHFGNNMHTLFIHTQTMYHIYSYIYESIVQNRALYLNMSTRHHKVLYISLPKLMLFN